MINSKEMVRVNRISGMDTDNIIAESSNGIGMLLFIIVVLDVITEGGDVGGVSVIMVALVIS